MSADNNAPEQVREVEVVAEVVEDGINRAHGNGHRIADALICDEIAERILRALAPARAAERQETARAAWDEGFFAATEAAPPDVWHGAWDDAPNPYRADGVTGRSGM